MKRKKVKLFSYELAKSLLEAEQNEIKKKRESNFKKSWRSPSRKDWIVNTPDSKVYFWNPWRMRFYQYKLGIGVISNSLRDIGGTQILREFIFCDEESTYYKQWLKILEDAELEVGSEPLRPLIKPLPKLEIPDGLILPPNYYICKNCSHLIHIIRGNHFRCDKCRHLVTINEKDNTEKYYDIEKQKEVVHRCIYEREHVDEYLLCPLCGRNIFKEIPTKNVVCVKHELGELNHGLPKMSRR